MTYENYFYRATVLGLWGVLVTCVSNFTRNYVTSQCNNRPVKRLPLVARLPQI